MKTSVAAVALLLVATACFSQDVDGPSLTLTCCTHNSHSPLPLRLLASYTRTSDDCPLPSVVFTTKGGKKICTDPRVAWTQDRIHHLDGN
ncbi:eotaxin-like [Hemicordylus capensis]|uniref:eotaxin-like n=1 Tax=Hemicordylus capensis TaxID=884348 RepID=UPI0023037DB6|nr:eotaxin-like [Hemicordylus capensis]XP_053159427.1 eotaxin-like [Hemicordylus capensis]XP_053160480.1 eotaxin-like [Hemicordylus capensis]